MDQYLGIRQKSQRRLRTQHDKFETYYGDLLKRLTICLIDEAKSGINY